MTKELQTELLVTSGLQFAEGLRWHDGRLWLSDLFGRAVYSVDGDALHCEVVLDDDQPSGLGFLPDGEPIVVAMKTRQLRKFGDGTASVYAEMAPAATSECNDMLIDPHGRAYVSTFGYDLRAGEEAKPGTLILVRPGEAAVVAADDLIFPNGIVLSPDGSELIVSELFGAMITAFEVAGDGSLGNRRTFAAIEGMTPDGLAIDAEGGVWVASSTAGEVLRVVDGGEVTHRISTPDEWATSCALGGTDGRTLFVACAKTTIEEWLADESVSYIRTVRVDVPAAQYA